MVRIKVQSVNVTPARIEELLDQPVSIAGTLESVRSILVRRGIGSLSIVRDTTTNSTVVTNTEGAPFRFEQLGNSPFDALTRLGTTLGRD